MRTMAYTVDVLAQFVLLRHAQIRDAFCLHAEQGFTCKQHNTVAMNSKAHHIGMQMRPAAKAIQRKPKGTEYLLS